MIIAIKDKDRVVIGYTLADSWGKLTNSDYVDEENFAIRFSKSGKVFACSDMNRSSDILLFDDEFVNMEVTPQTIVRAMIPYMRGSLNENGAPVDKEGFWKNALLICDDEHIYDVGPHFDFREVDDFICRGYGYEHVTSALDATAHLAPEERILNAVNFTSKVRKESLFPLVITDTKTKQFKYIYNGEC